MSLCLAPERRTLKAGAVPHSQLPPVIAVLCFLISAAVGGMLLPCTAPLGSALSPRLPSPHCLACSLDPSLWKPRESSW